MSSFDIHDVYMKCIDGRYWLIDGFFVRLPFSEPDAKFMFAFMKRVEAMQPSADQPFLCFTHLQVTDDLLCTPVPQERVRDPEVVERARFMYDEWIDDTEQRQIENI